MSKFDCVVGYRYLCVDTVWTHGAETMWFTCSLYSRASLRKMKDGPGDPEMACAV